MENSETVYNEYSLYLCKSLKNVLLPALWQLPHASLVFQNENHRHQYENFPRYPNMMQSQYYNITNLLIQTEMQTENPESVYIYNRITRAGDSEVCWEGDAGAAG